MKYRLPPRETVGYASQQNPAPLEESPGITVWLRKLLPPKRSSSNCNLLFETLPLRSQEPEFWMQAHCSICFRRLCREDESLLTTLKANQRHSVCSLVDCWKHELRKEEEKK
ncbi:hypothetical protein R1flu_015936 [Riccia fluitans]|uniref:Uncharacterized protein n=1 Tax=Riccia fluitans TaxID=41844 RepID=A0ABD1YKN0_9MARC